MGVKKADSRKLEKEKLLAEVKNYLLKKGFQPGDIIDTEFELAKHFNVSRYKIRDATTTLTQMGILEKSPRRGTVLKSFDSTAVVNDLSFRFEVANFNQLEYIEARKVVETAILPLAIRRITPAQLERLEQSYARMKACKHDYKKADEADKEFHLVLLEACGNRVLQAFAQVIHVIFKEGLRKKYWSPEMLEFALRLHRELLDAIHENDTEKALEIMKEHFKKT